LRLRCRWGIDPPEHHMLQVTGTGILIQNKAVEMERDTASRHWWCTYRCSTSSAPSDGHEDPTAWTSFSASSRSSMAGRSTSSRRHGGRSSPCACRSAHADRATKRCRARSRVTPRWTMVGTQQRRPQPLFQGRAYPVSTPPRAEHAGSATQCSGERGRNGGGAVRSHPMAKREHPRPR
jgi:hypothetical protein